VIASPIYWFTVSAQTKLFMDRWYALGGDDGYALAGKQFGIVLAYADADPFTSGAVNALRTFQDAFNYIGPKWWHGLRQRLEGGRDQEEQALMDAAYALGKKMAAD